MDVHSTGFYNFNTLTYVCNLHGNTHHTGLIIDIKTPIYNIKHFRHMFLSLPRPVYVTFMFLKFLRL